MFPFNWFPNTNMYDLDLDWLLKTVKELSIKMEDFVTSFTNPVIVYSSDEMTNDKLIYLYVGDEYGYNTNHWYYYNADQGVWVDGGLYGSAIVDNALSETSTNPVQNKVVTSVLKYYATPEEFGAVGDGATNDAAAVQEALDDGRPVFFRSGAVYETGDTSLYVRRNYTQIQGNGATIKKTTTDGVTSGGIIVDGYSNVSIDGVCFIGDFSESMQFNQHDHAISINNSSYSTIKNCYFNNVEGDCIYIGGTGQVNTLTIENCKFRKCGRWGISVIDGRAININNNTFMTNDTCCIDIEPNSAAQKNIVSITNNKSFRCGQLVNVALSYSLTDINIIVSDWTSIMDSVSNTNTEQYPDKLDGGLIGLRIPGGVSPEGNLIIKNVSFNECTGRMFYERVLYAPFNVVMNDINVNDCSGDVMMTSRTDHNNTRITRQISLEVDTNTVYTNFAELTHGAGVTDGAIVYNVHKTGNLAASILTNSTDKVNLYDVADILKIKDSTVTSSTGTVQVRKIVEYNGLHMMLIFFTPTSTIPVNGNVLDFTTGTTNTVWVFNGGGQQGYFYDDSSHIKTAFQLTGGTSYRGYIYWID